MRALAIILVVLGIAGFVQAEDKPAQKSPKSTEKQSAKPAGKQSEKRPENLVPLIRFYDHKFNQHIYTYTEDEADKWRSIPHVKEHQIIGDVATAKTGDAVPLWRAIRTQGKESRHFYYLRTTGVQKNTFIDVEAFKAYVWLKPGEGRIPIYCTTWTDSTDAFFDPDLEIVRTNRDDTKKSTGVQRRGLAGQDTSVPVFYIYAHPEADSPKDKPEVKTENPNSEPAKTPKSKSAPSKPSVK